MNFALGSHVMIYPTKPIFWAWPNIAKNSINEVEPNSGKIEKVKNQPTEVKISLKDSVARIASEKRIYSKDPIKQTYL